MSENGEVIPKLPLSERERKIIAEMMANLMRSASARSLTKPEVAEVDAALFRNGEIYSLVPEAANPKPIEDMTLEYFRRGVAKVMR